MKPEKKTAGSREKEIVKTSVVGVAANVLLSAFKAAVGLLSGSIAIVMDAINNLSDALSSIITIVGMKLAAKPADKEHPYGHGRAEYLSAVVIAGIVLAAGVSSFVEAIKKILHPQAPAYTAVTLVIISSAILVKLFLGVLFQRKGKTLHSDSLVASGKDALFDAVISIATLISAGVMLIWNVSVDGFLGAAISLIIIKSGLDIMVGALNRILGVREASELTQGIRAKILSVDGVDGAFDLILHNYGPDNRIGSVHIEVPETMTSGELHVLTRKIQRAVLEDYGVFLTVGIYAIKTDNPAYAAMQRKIISLVCERDGVLQMHGLYIDFDDKMIQFDIVVDFQIKNPDELRSEIREALANAFPEYRFEINIDRDYSD